MKRTLLPLPQHFAAQNAMLADYRVTDVSRFQKEAENYRTANNLKPVGSDRKNIHLLVIDDQYDFTFPTGALFVGGRSGTGAMDDQRRLAQFVYQNLDLISQVTVTMDSHLPFQIFFPSAHVRADGSHPDPHTIITGDEYRAGIYRPNPAMAKQIGIDPVWLGKQFAFYCDELEKTGKYKLYLWPYHCMIGSNGHQLSGLIEEMRLFHAFARGAANLPEIKGGNPLTEHYSIFMPEVTKCWDGRAIPGAQRNTLLIEKLLKSNYVIIAGQASSHCVRASIQDFLNEILAVDPELAKKVYILRDCTSAVVVPGIADFTPEAEEAFAAFKEKGMHIVDSATPIEDWPGMVLG